MACLDPGLPCPTSQLEAGTLGRVAAIHASKHHGQRPGVAVTDFARCGTVDQVRAVLERSFAENEFDGYELEFVSTAVDGVSREVRMAWCKPESVSILSGPSVWRLELLLGGEIKTRGHFRVYREDSDRPLMLDINLLTRFFPGDDMN